MSITVANAYRLPSLRNVKILTGESGFHNSIDRMGILDYEFISYKMQGEFIKNDFVLSSFLFAKDDVSLLVAAIKTLIDNGVSCLGIKDVYYKELPVDLINYAKEKSFSIFLFGHDVYFEDIITEINDTLRLIDSNRLIEMKVDNLTQNQLSPALVREIALDINSDFKENCAVIYCRATNHSDDGHHYRSLDRLKRLDFFKGEHSIFKYKNGMMGIFTFDESNTKTPKLLLQIFLGQTGLLTDDYLLGVSDFHPRLHHLSSAIAQSLHACRVCEIENKHICFHHDIGLYKIILPFRDSYWMQTYYESMIRPLRDYDEKYSAELLSTAVCYIDHQGSIKETAQYLFQHENTIRYRIHKAKEILNMTQEGSNFYPQLYMAVLLHRLYME